MRADIWIDTRTQLRAGVQLVGSNNTHARDLRQVRTDQDFDDIRKKKVTIFQS